VIGPEVAFRLKELGLPSGGRLADTDEFRCSICQMDGSVGDGSDAALMMYQFTDGPLLRLAHTRCSVSRVIKVDTPMSLGSAGDLDDVISLAVTMPGPSGGPVATLFVDKSDASGFFTPGGGFIDPWFQTLLEDKWDLFVARSADLPTVVSGYEILFDESTRDGAISSPGGGLLDRLPEIPTLWFEAARKNGTIVVFAGALGLKKLGDAVSAEGLFKLLDKARQRGEVATARVKVGRQAPPEANVARDAADALEKIMYATEPGDGSHLDEAMLVVPYAVPPRLLVADFAGTPTLIVDLNDEDDARGRATMKAFQRAGFGVVEENKMWKMMPDGWGAVLWPSQAMVQAPKVGDEPRLMLFAKYDVLAEGLVWYQQFKEDGASVFVMVLNLKGAEMTENAVTNRIRRRRVLGGAMFAMGTV